MTDDRKLKDPIERAEWLVSWIKSKTSDFDIHAACFDISHELAKIAEELEKARANVNAWREQCARRRCW